MNNSAQMMEACQVFTPKQSKTKHKVFFFPFSLFIVFTFHVTPSCVMEIWTDVCAVSVSPALLVRLDESSQNPQDQYSCPVLPVH